MFKFRGIIGTPPLPLQFLYRKLQEIIHNNYTSLAIRPDFKWGPSMIFIGHNDVYNLMFISAQEAKYRAWGICLAHFALGLDLLAMWSFNTAWLARGCSCVVGLMNVMEAVYTQIIWTIGTAFFLERYFTKPIFMSDL